MKLREDVDFLSGLVESKLISLPKAKELAALPVMMIPNATLPGNEEFLKFWDEEIKTMNGNTKFNFLEWEDIPFWDFIIIVNYNPNWRKVRSRDAEGKEPLPGTAMAYCRLSVDQENKIIKKSYSNNGFSWSEVEVDLNRSDDLTLEEITLKVFNVKDDKVDAVRKSIYLKDIYENCFNEVVAGAMMWHRFHCRSDRYTIAVKSNGKYKTDNGRTADIAKVLGPRIIYLDKLPSEEDEVTSLNNNGSKAPHQRKGHWVTLRSERFKNHSKYMVKNGIYRKPAWIGDRTRIVHGATYTVMDKPVNLEE